MISNTLSLRAIFVCIHHNKIFENEVDMKPHYQRSYSFPSIKSDEYILIKDCSVHVIEGLANEG